MFNNSQMKELQNWFQKTKRVTNINNFVKVTKCGIISDWLEPINTMYSSQSLTNSVMWAITGDDWYLYLLRSFKKIT